MKSVLLVVSLFFSFTVFAQVGETFATQKAEAITRLDNKIASLQKTKTCCQAAKDNAELRACRKELRESHQGMKMENRGKRRDRMKEKMNKSDKKMN